MVGQPRALSAVGLGLDIDTPGYNLFVAGPAGTGRRSMIASYLRERASQREAPSDWLYLFNFGAEEQPLAVSLPPGRASAFATEMARFVKDARERIPLAFESESYERRRRELAEELERRRDEAVGNLREFAKERNLALELTPAGPVTIPIVDGRPMEPRQFRALPDEARHQFEESNQEVQAELPGVMKQLREIEREIAARIRDLERDVALFAIGQLIDEIKAEFSESETLAGWLDQVREDVIENLERMRHDDTDADGQLPEPLAAGMRRAREEFFRRYEPNVLVGNGGDAGAPVVFETNPTYYNLFGRVEYEAAFGAVTTDHRHIKPGALHRANGGYLVLQAIDMLTQPFVWPKLKETLRTRAVKIESIGTQLMLFPTTTLEPQPIDLDVKVILIGPSRLYALLYLLDEDVRKLFKVRVDFDVTMARDQAESAQYAAFIARRIADDGLKHFHRDAVARVVEHGSRISEHQGKLSLRLIEVADLVTEASHWAVVAGSDLVRPDHVERAIEEKVYRSNLIEEKIRELIGEGTLAIDTEGERTGQVNGLSVIPLGDYAFGRPSRITSTVAVGSGEVVNIDRETEMSGPIHDKGFLILSGFLQERFGGDKPLSLHASTVFEQSYDEVEGDSASGAELFALLSALADLPVKQGIAVTGSVNQHGEIQAIGAVNEKIEGFYRVCAQLGLNGEQGVVIPVANLEHLMLRPDVVGAVEEGRFSVWAIRTVDEGIEILTGVPAGERDAEGRYPEGSVNRRVEDRLSGFADIGRRFRGRDENGGAGAGAAG